MSESKTETLEFEAEGETVGEAKWLAVRELEKLQPALDKSAVVFEILSEGERGLLGVGRSPARVVARVPAGAVADAHAEESEIAATVRELLERISDASGVRCRVEVSDDGETVTGVLNGGDLGLLIGKHGQTIDSIQYIASSVVHRRFGETAQQVVVDAAGYRERRRVRLHALAERSAEQALDTGRPVELEPMPPSERKLVHLRLQDYPGVETRSEGDEPNRYVVIVPTAD
jgi:spoIIIJ-associated protein